MVKFGKQVAKHKTLVIIICVLLLIDVYKRQMLH